MPTTSDLSQQNAMPLPPNAVTPPTDEINSPYHDFRAGASWRVFRIMAEFIEGFEFLSDLKKEVSIFGSTRVKPEDPLYQEAQKLGQLLGKAGFTTVTGGGPGIMEAGNRGANDVGAESVGINIQLPHEQRVNPYVNKSAAFHYFFTRKVILTISSQAYIFFPGGFGTLDELLELLVLIQTKKMIKIPIVLVGKKFWSGFEAWIKSAMINDHEYIDPVNDLTIFQIVDSADEAFAIVKKTMEREMFE